MAAAAAKDGNDRVLAAAQQILKSLGTTKDVKEDMVLILSNFDNRFSAITDLLPAATVEERLAVAEETVLGFGGSTYSSTPTRLPYADPPGVGGGDVGAYLSAVDEIFKLMDDLTASPPPQGSGDLMERCEVVLQMAMSKVEDEFRRILSSNAAPLEADRGSAASVLGFSPSFASSDRDDNGSDSDNAGLRPLEDAISKGGGSLRGLSMDLVNPNAIDDLRDLAERMSKAGYEKECSRVYCRVRREAYDEYLLFLGVERLGIEEVQKMGWKILDEKIEKWIRAVKFVIRVLLSAEKQLCDQIFDGSELMTEDLFVETAKGCVTQLITFAESIAIGQRSPDKLFRMLDMHAVLADLLPDLQAIFSDESSKFIWEDVQRIVVSLGEAGMGMLVEFEKAVQNEASRKPVLGADIHPFTRYVMDYATLLTDYKDSLNLLLQNVVSDDGSNGEKVHNIDGDRSSSNSLQQGNGSPLSHRLLSVLSCLESKLEDKSKLYEDMGMQYVFLMNNVLYMVQKVKGSELQKLLGELWVRRHRGLIRQYSTGYLRASWSRVLSCLKDEGISSGGVNSSDVSRVTIKERFKKFNLCFEELYRNQSAWKVPDAQLREELQISISERVIPAYRSFLGRFRSRLDGGRHVGKYIRYMPEDLEKHLMGLFEGTSGIIHHQRKKSYG